MSSKHALLATTASTVFVLLSACNSTMPVGQGYNPSVLTEGLDMQKYESDRAACAQAVAAQPANYEPTNVVNFRACLLGKGYRLLN